MYPWDLLPLKTMTTPLTGGGVIDKPLETFLSRLHTLGTLVTWDTTRRQPHQPILGFTTYDQLRECPGDHHGTGATSAVAPVSIIFFVVSEYEFILVRVRATVFLSSLRGQHVHLIGLVAGRHRS